MAKVQIKSEKLTPFGGIFSIMEQFDALLAQTIDSSLGLRCTMFGYQYSEILRSLMCVYLCGVTQACIEHLLRQQYLCQPVQDRLWLKTMLFWLNQRITSSRFMG
ncbi:putative transposase [Parabacteroides distasonis str. 3999B T(B) 4]|nr:putative transposase [Parabacteroides distasonis str. 3999B T(B) 4]